MMTFLMCAASFFAGFGACILIAMILALEEDRSE